jgi:hypothetical protein
MTQQRGALPTLTEVIEVSTELLPATAPPTPLAAESLPLESPFVAPAVTRSALTTQVLEALRPRIDALLDARVRDVLAPQLSRLADAAMLSVRTELAGVVQALVAQAVDEVLAQRRRL